MPSDLKTRLLCRQHPWWLVALMLACLPRLLTPTGFMPVNGGQLFELQICDGHTHHPAGSETPAEPTVTDGSCAFAAGAVAGTLPAPLAFASAACVSLAGAWTPAILVLPTAVRRAHTARAPPAAALLG